MNDSRRIVICGASIYMLAIESGLSEMAVGDVVCVDPHLPNTVERICLLEPHAVIMERNGKSNQLALEILCQSIPLIVLDEAQRSITVLVTEHLPKAEISELNYVIDKINQKQFERRMENVN